jgi:putative flippase GtrA
MPVVDDNGLVSQSVRYAINGFVATAIHFAVLTFNLQVLGLASAGVANGIAAVFGISASFIGSRYFVFRGTTGRLLHQGFLFALTYAGIAMLHALILYGWTDRLGHDYRIGFVIASIAQVILSFLLNRTVVFG